MAYRKYFSLLAVLASSVAVLATSSMARWPLQFGEFDVKSDCTYPIIEGPVTVQNFQIVPTGPITSYLVLGFPTSIVIPGQDSVGGLRVCKNTYANDKEGDWIFSCYDSGNLQCTIYIKHR